MVWERPLQHSLPSERGGAGLTGGFVIPYQAVLRELERNADLDPLDYIAFAPEDSLAQLSYGSEQVTHGPAAAALVSAREALERTANILTGP